MPRILYIFFLLRQYYFIGGRLKEEPFNLGHYRCRVIYNQVPGTPVILLHGYSFTSDVWRDIGLLERLEAEEIPFAAIDMPYGARSTCSPRTREPEENVWIVREVVKGLFSPAKPVLIGASLGGYIALKYITRHPAAGAVLIAPVGGLEPELASKYVDVALPIMIIYGTRDRVVPRREIEELARRLEATLSIYEGAKHPAYLDQPERFIKDVLAFYKALHLE